MQSEVQDGRMFLFGADPYRRLPVFLSGNGNRCIIVIGGQTDGFFSLNYLSSLVKEVNKSNWTVAQAQLSSSHAGCNGNHVADARDLDELINIMLVQHAMKEIVLFGYSTGVQVVLECMKEGKYTEGVTRVILQGVVRETTETDIFELEASTKRLAQAESSTRAGEGASYSVMAGHYDIPVTAGRVSAGGFLSIQEAIWNPSQKDDLQSLRSALEVIKCPLMVMFARQCEYREKQAIKAEEAKIEAIVRKAAATNDVNVSFFEEVCDERRRMLNTAQGAHTAAVVMFLQEQDKNRSDREEAARLLEAEESRRSRSILAKSELKLLGA